MKYFGKIFWPALLAHQPMYLQFARSDEAVSSDIHKEGLEEMDGRRRKYQEKSQSWFSLVQCLTLTYINEEQ